MPLSSLRSEYERYRDLAERALAQVDDDAFFASTGEDLNSTAVIGQHIAGNLLSRFTDFLTTDGEKPWRNRDGEFEEPARDRAALMRRWDEAWRVLVGELEGLGPEHLQRTVTIRGTRWPVVAALHRSLAHTAYHVGQIVFAARQATGSSWSSLSIPRGMSASYNNNPHLERAPEVDQSGGGG